MGGCLITKQTRTNEVRLKCVCSRNVVRRDPQSGRMPYHEADAHERSSFKMRLLKKEFMIYNTEKGKRAYKFLLPFFEKTRNNIDI